MTALPTGRCRRRRVLAAAAMSAMVAASVAAALPAAALSPPTFPVAAAAPGVGCAASEPSAVHRGAQPWPQTELGADEVWFLGQGAGVTVALLSSGVDATNEQLTDSVTGGFDALTGGAGADRDCDGRGTRAAGTLAANASPETSVQGVAPDVTLLPVRVVQRVASADDPSDSEDVGGGPLEIAAGIDWAVTQGARIICVTVTTDRDDPILQAAVAAATASGAIIVSGGPLGDETGIGGADEVPAPRYPSAYPQVLSVGALARDGTLLPLSERGTYLDILAPAAETISTASTGGRGGLGHGPPQDDPAAATAAVAGALALMLNRDPALSAEAAGNRAVGTGLPASRAISASLGPIDQAVGSPPAPPVLNVAAAMSAHLVSPRQPLAGTRIVPMPDDSGLDAAERRALSWASVIALAGVAGATAAVVVRSRRRTPRSDRRPG